MSDRCEIAKVDDERQMVFGWAYKTAQPDGSVIIDKQGDFVDDSWELEAAAYDFVLNSGQGDVMHLEVPVSKMVESVVFTPEKVEKMGLPAGSMPTAWWVGFHVPDAEDWQAVRKLREFSIGGSGVRESVDDHDLAKILEGH